MTSENEEAGLLKQILRFLVWFAFFATLDLTDSWIHSHFHSVWGPAICKGLVWGIFYVLIELTQSERSFRWAITPFIFGLVGAPLIYVKWGWWVVADLAVLAGLMFLSRTKYLRSGRDRGVVVESNQHT